MILIFVVLILTCIFHIIGWNLNKRLFERIENYDEELNKKYSGNIMDNIDEYLKEENEGYVLQGDKRVKIINIRNLISKILVVLFILTYILLIVSFAVLEYEIIPIGLILFAIFISVFLLVRSEMNFWMEPRTFVLILLSFLYGIFYQKVIYSELLLLNDRMFICFGLVFLISLIFSIKNFIDLGKESPNPHPRIIATRNISIFGTITLFSLMTLIGGIFLII